MNTAAASVLLVVSLTFDVAVEIEIHYGYVFSGVNTDTDNCSYVLRVLILFGFGHSLVAPIFRFW